MGGKGLKKFLREVFDGSSTGQSNTRIIAELVKIKKVFLSTKIKPYTRWKCIVKLCFIVLWGHPVNFGLNHILTLINSQKIREKRGGWMAACIMLSAEQESVIEQLIPCLRDQLDDSNDQVRRVALNAVSGLGGEALIDAVGPTIAEMAVDPTIDKYLQRRAILTLAGIYQSSHQLPSVDKVAPKLASFLADPDWGMKMCAANLIQAILVQQPALVCDIFSVVLKQLHSMFVPEEETVRPLLVCKMIQILEFKPEWNEEEIQIIQEICESILRRDERNMSSDAIVSFFTMFAEVAALVDVVSLSEEVVRDIMRVLISGVQSETPYVVLYSLETIANLIRSIPRVSEMAKPITERLIEMMKSRDRMTDSAAIQLLYMMTDVEDGLHILSEFSCFLPDAPHYLSESLAKKCIVLTQSYALDHKWGIDKILSIMSQYEIHDDTIWPILVHYVAYDSSLQNYLLKALFDLITKDCVLTEPIMQLSAYAFGAFIESYPAIDGRTVFTIFESLFETFSENAQPIVISALAKLSVKFGDIKSDVLAFFERTSKSTVTEVSQRSREYLKVLSLTSELVTVCLTPSYSERFKAPISLLETVADRKEQEYVLDTEVKCSNSSGVLHLHNLDVHVNVQIIPPNAEVGLEIVAMDDTIITRFEVKSDSRLLYKIGGTAPKAVLAGAHVKISIEFMAIGIFRDVPTIHISYGDDKILEVEVPIALAKWMQPWTMDEKLFTKSWQEITDPACIRTASLIIPDGDVISAVCEITKATLGLNPVEFDVPKHTVLMSGSFLCWEMTIGVLVKFVYMEDDVDLIFEVRATAQSAVDAIVVLVREAFSK